jgi:hypothetical protein
MHENLRFVDDFATVLPRMCALFFTPAKMAVFALDEASDRA